MADGVTLVKREPEWDDDSREDMIALAEYEAGICNCGIHRSLTHDKANFFSFVDDVCPVCRGAAQYGRMQAAKDEVAVKALGEKPQPTAPRPDDGRSTYVTKLSDGEVAERRKAQLERRSRS